MVITIHGSTPAQKNSKSIAINRRTHKPFIMSNKNVTDWKKDALKQLDAVDIRYEVPVKLDYLFYVKDNRIKDLDNMIATVNDTLQAAGIISGDHWQVLEIGSAKGQIDKEFPRAEITISLLDN